MNRWFQLLLLVIIGFGFNSKVLFSQNTYGLIEYSRIEAFIEKELISKTPYFEKIMKYQDSIQQQNYQFYHDQLQAFQKRYNGACMSEKDMENGKEYLRYLEKSVSQIDSMIQDIELKTTTKFKVFVNQAQAEIINQLKNTNQVNHLFNKATLAYFDANTIDYTNAILQALAAKKTAIRKAFYIKINKDGDDCTTLFSMQNNFISYQEYQNRKHHSK